MKSKKLLQKEREHWERIIKERDLEKLFQLEDNVDFSYGLYQIIYKEYEDCGKQIDALSHAKRTIWLCMFLDEVASLDGVISFFESGYGWYAQYAGRTVAALKEIGAPKYAELFQQAIDILPEELCNGTDQSFEKVEDLMWDQLNEIENQLYDYPDGNINDLIRNYAVAHRSEL